MWSYMSLISLQATFSGQRPPLVIVNSYSAGHHYLESELQALACTSATHMSPLHIRHHIMRCGTWALSRSSQWARLRIYLGLGRNFFANLVRHLVTTLDSKVLLSYSKLAVFPDPHMDANACSQKVGSTQSSMTEQYCVSLHFTAQSSTLDKVSGGIIPRHWGMWIQDFDAETTQRTM